MKKKEKYTTCICGIRLYSKNIKKHILSHQHNEFIENEKNKLMEIKKKQNYEQFKIDWPTLITE